MHLCERKKGENARERERSPLETPDQFELQDPLTTTIHFWPRSIYIIVI